MKILNKWEMLKRAEVGGILQKFDFFFLDKREKWYSRVKQKEKSSL